VSLYTAPMLLDLACSLSLTAPAKARWYALQAATLATTPAMRASAMGLWGAL